jgi:DNA repair protein RadC
MRHQTGNMNTSTRKPWIALQNKALEGGIKSLHHDELVQLISAPSRHVPGPDTALIAAESLKMLRQSSIGEFCHTYQVGIGLACKLAASMELGTRYWSEPPKRGATLNDPQQVRKWLRCEFRDRSCEVFACAFLDARHRLIRFEELFNGGIDGTEIYPRVVIQQCLRHQAAAVLLVHNHPSGHPEPSAADHAVTARLKQAMALLDIRVLDHFIVAGNSITSFAERGWL